jgi:hypothetical protein
VERWRAVRTKEGRGRAGGELSIGERSKPREGSGKRTDGYQEEEDRELVSFQSHWGGGIWE